MIYNRFKIHANPKVEICAFKDGEWLRIAGELAEDGNTEMFYFRNATVTFSSFTHEAETYEF